jgi:hypothetical protein
MSGTLPITKGAARRDDSLAYAPCPSPSSRTSSRQQSHERFDPTLRAGGSWDSSSPTRSPYSPYSPTKLMLPGWDEHRVAHQADPSIKVRRVPPASPAGAWYRASNFERYVERATSRRAHGHSDRSSRPSAAAAGSGGRARASICCPSWRCMLVASALGAAAACGYTVGVAAGLHAQAAVSQHQAAVGGSRLASIASASLSSMLRDNASFYDIRRLSLPPLILRAIGRDDLSACVMGHVMRPSLIG